MGKVADILQHKGLVVHGIAPDATVHEAVVCMVAANVGSLLVLDDDELVGIVTERDYLRRVALSDRSPRSLEVREVMTSPVMSVSSDTTIDECMALMTERRFRHLPVVDEGQLVGVVSIGDLVKARSAEQTTQISVLHEYITAR